MSGSPELQQRVLALHHSQMTVREDDARGFIEKTAQENGKPIGVKYAEAFQRIVCEAAPSGAEGTRAGSVVRLVLSVVEGWLGG